MPRTPLLGLLAVVVGCSGDSQPDTDKRERPSKRVQVESVTKRALEDVLVLPATVEARELTTLATGRPGRIESLGADAGDTVKRGRTLVRINAGSAYAELKQAEAGLASAKATFERTQQLRERKLASDANYEQARATLAQAEASLEAARAGVADAVIRAPHSGTIATRYVSVGEYASSGQALMDLVDIAKVKVMVRVPERDIDSISVGSEVAFQVDALGEDEFSGAIARVGVLADPAARTFEVELLAPNPGARLKPGMLARVRLPRRALDDVPVIRRDAVVEDLDGPTVFVAAEGIASRRKVVLGPVSGDWVAVREGLEVGESLVVVGQRMLVEGEPIKVVNDPIAPAEPVAKAEE